LDVGSGAGFPGIPLKIVRPDLKMTLIEPAAKKASFLHFIIGCLQLVHTKVYDNTLERFLAQPRLETYEYMTTRALKYQMILERGIPLLREGGKVILYLSQPINGNLLPSPWIIEKETIFELPSRKGHRVITVLRVA
jgi:16S rRNA (guanine527-N7)-methyltransferase